MNKKLSELDNGINNNVFLAKFIASLLVIYAHSYPLTGMNENIISNKIGSIAVAFFFFISGYYSIKKLYKDNNYFSFIKSRIKNLWPLLIEVTLILAFIIGPTITNVSLRTYFLSKETYMYLLVILMIRMHNLPGVFVDNPYGCEVNGSLWTLPFQCICYLTAIVFHRIVLKIKKNILIILNLFLLIIDIILPLLLDGYLYSVIGSGYRACLVFFIGMEYFYFNKVISISYIKLILLFLISLLLYFIGFYNVFYYFFLPYLFCILLFKNQMKKKTNIFGSLSYPVYLLGFPVQQLLVFISNNSMNPIINWLISSIACIIISLILLTINKYICKIILKTSRL